MSKTPHGSIKETTYTPKLAGLDDLGSSLINLTIDAARLRANLRLILDFIAPAQLIAVVKADAYGFGASGLVPVLSEFDNISLGVATPDEALELKASGFAGRIILLGYTHPKCYYQIIHSGCQLSVYRPENIPLLAEMSSGLTRPLELHVKVDTGMTRLGVALSGLEDFLNELKRHPQLCVVGLFSHMADSGNPDNELNLLQGQRFEEAIGIAVKCLGYRPECHLANSAAMLNYTQLQHDSVRVGQLLFGIYPPGRYEQRLPVEPCFRLSSEVIDLHRIGPGDGVSYGHSFRAERPCTIATLPYGYADGQPRALSNRGHVLIRGRRYPLVGTITMDYVMANLGDDEVAVGDEAVFIGRQGSEEITIEQVAEQCGYIPYQVSCAWNRRVRRVYVEY